MIEVSSLEWHVSHNCNFSCNGCSDFSNVKHTQRITPQILESWYVPWHQRIKPKTVALVGGEPLLNKDIETVITTAKQYWNNSNLELVTNGWLLKRYPNLSKVLKDTDTMLYISKHYDSDEYNTVFNNIIDYVESLDINYKIYRNHKTWFQIYKGTGADIEPFEDNDPKSSWNNCPTYQDCFQLYDGCIWKCPPVAYLNLMAKNYKLSSKWDTYLKYRALQPNCTDQQIINFFNKGAEHVCGMCPSKLRITKQEVEWQH
jgi:organic radical activating enzyme